MGKGKGGGGGKGVSGGVGGPARFRFIRGLFKFGGLCPTTKDALTRVAVARGLRDVDQLLLSLGKHESEVTLSEALDLVGKEVGTHALSDIALSGYYRAGKGYDPCNRLINDYMVAVQKGDGDSRRSQIRRNDLKKYCGYNDDELKC